MKFILIKILLNKEIGTKISVLRIKYRKKGTMVLTKESVDDLKTWFQRSKPSDPLLIEILGDRVIRRRYTDEDDIIHKVVGSGDFIWKRSKSEDGEGDLIFIRKEHTEELVSLVEQYGSVMSIVLDDRENWEAEELYRIEPLLCEILSFKNIWQKGASGYYNLWAKKVMFPVLILLLLISGVNYRINSHLNNKHNLLRGEYDLLSKRIEGGNKEEDRLRHFINRHHVRSDISFSLISDRVAGHIPDKLRLSELSLIPLLRAPEKGKPLQPIRNTIRIRGEADDAETVSLLSKRLAGEEFWKQVRLTSMGKKRDSDLFVFEIQLEL